MPGPTLTELEPGLVQITMPLPWALDHVHCYALKGSDGWSLVDAGLGSEATLRWWTQALAQLGPEPVARLVLTHYHPDHVGASAGLAELSGAREVVQGRLDRAMAVAAWEHGSDDEFEGYLRDHGMPAELAAASTRAESRTGVRLATPTRLVDEGDRVALGDETFRVLHLPGHADGHIALLGSHSGRLFGGDVLLNEITPNIGRWDDNDPDPLASYLATLARIRELAPAVVYPGHRTVIDDPAARALEIALHHAERLDEHEAALREGARSAYDVAQLVWGGRLGFHEQRFAVAEALAHIERLAGEGRAVPDDEPNRWRAA